MAVYRGGGEQKSIFRGSTKIDKIYKGDSLVYQSTNFVVLTIVAVPSDATITFEAPQESIIDTTENTITVIKETTVKYTVSADNYISQSGTVVVDKNQTINITLKTLSDEYDLLEYLQSNAQSIIDTGIPGGKNTYRIELASVLPFHEDDAVVYGNWRGVQHDANDYSSLPSQYANDNTICYWGINPKAAWWGEFSNNNKGSSGYELVGLSTEKVVAVSTHESITLDGTTYNMKTDVGTENTANIILYDYGLNARSHHDAQVKIYYFKIYDSDVLILDLIPARNKATQELGMYDKVSGKFLTDADPDAKGSGFTAGPVLS